MTGRPITRAVLVALVLLSGCRARQITVREIASPAAPGSAEPCVEAGADGRAYLSWIEPAGAGRHALRFSVWEGSGWSHPRTVAEGADWFVNWADFPSLTALNDGTLAAHWLRKTGGGSYAYGVALSFSRDGGTTWSEPLTPHDDSKTEHGFVSKVALPSRRIAAIWLDGRETGGGDEGHSGPMTLRAAVVGTDGKIEHEDVIDARVCDCCQTSAVRLGDGAVVVAYRDRSESEIRDIAVARFENERWSEPIVVHDDRWEIAGCPVNGPAIAADGDRVAVTWFTAAGSPPMPRVRIAFSNDGGRHFEPPIEVSDGRPEGRVDVVFLDDGAVLMTWIDAGEGSAQLLARRIDSNGSLGPHVRIASSSVARAGGFPRMARLGSDIVVSWTETGDPSHVRTAVLSQEQ
jgi:hypothetical protein